MILEDILIKNENIPIINCSFFTFVNSMLK